MAIRVRKDSIIGKPRKENGSFYLITPKIYPKPHFINSYIFNLWKESEGRTINEITSTYEKKYPYVDREKIKSDILNSLVYLNNLKMIDIIDEEEVMGVMKGNGISLVNEIDFRRVSEFILDTYSSSRGLVFNFEYEGILDSNSVKDIYSIQMMRLNQIHGKEMYFKFFDKFKNLNAIIGITVLNSISTCYINTIAVSESSNKNLNNIMEQFIEYLQVHNIECFKIKTSDIEIVNSFASIKFNIEAELKNELLNKKSLYIIRRG
ncbi:hypothetical protein PN298_07550 [Peptostreptococcus anaerobius]|uniref:hypothetical protein n=1 Tax=Peptostreptococcus anaerobius TaxID=1261 RepID=UPI00232CDAED|nr:hypothetical protein [Peptostreptococcus anaerobius]HEN4571340.1 hypothetical protein [Streptococcus agalactiae]MDB8850519.1 hypothetical protein [Peptostreptococcus anaerobius]MDB8854229.1 hypothetical protein [Peptostreptococcus anaerobius]MDB8856087.1 hypothetical protein [Peptostreptococcus anaerobius]HEN4572924.1 hypothetical protein [Streptococcus agalactiae]